MSVLEIASSARELVAELVHRLPRCCRGHTVVAVDLGPPGSSSGADSVLADPEFAEEIEQLVRRTSALAGIHAALLADRYVESGRSPGAAAVQVAEDVGIERGDARSRVERGKRAATLEGRALAAGEITERQEKAYAGIRATAQGYLDDEAIEDLIAALLEDTADRSSVTITRRGRKRLAEICPTWAADRKKRLHDGRAASVSQGADGHKRLTVVLDSKSEAIISSILARYGKVGRLVGLYDDRGSLLYDGTTGFTPHRRPDGGPVDTFAEARETERRDERTTVQRNFDALLFVLLRGLRVEGTASGGVASIVVRMTPEELDHPDRLVETDAGAQLSVADAVALAGKNPWFVSCLRDGEETLQRIDFDDRSRRRRSASALQRVAMYAAHGGCTHPGCEVPAAQCEAHHLREWWRGGLTELSNLAMACTAHHAQVGEGPGKWKTTPVEGHPGLARWEQYATCGGSCDAEGGREAGGEREPGGQRESGGEGEIA